MVIVFLLNNNQESNHHSQVAFRVICTTLIVPFGVL